MKTVLTTGDTFAPAQRRVDFSAVPGFGARRLLAVIHGPTGRMIYAAATPALGYTALASGILTLAFDTTTGMSASDPLTVLYEADAFFPDNPAHVVLDALPPGLALDASAQAVVTALATLRTDLSGNHADLTAIHTDTGGHCTRTSARC